MTKISWTSQQALDGPIGETKRRRDMVDALIHKHMQWKTRPDIVDDVLKIENPSPDARSMAQALRRIAVGKGWNLSSRTGTRGELFVRITGRIDKKAERRAKRMCSGDLDARK